MHIVLHPGRIEIAKIQMTVCQSKFVRYLGAESDQEKVLLPKTEIVGFKLPDNSSRTEDVTALWKVAQDLRLTLKNILKSAI
jgi:hypothetical protein